MNTTHLVQFFFGGATEVSGLLAHSPADVLGDLIVDLGHGTQPTDNGSWPVYASLEPNEPDDAITTFDTASVLDGRHQVTGEVQEHNGVQVRIRSDGHTEGYNKANDILIALDEDVYDKTVTIEGSSYHLHSVSRRGGILALGRDGKNSKRVVFVMNVLVSLRKK